MPLIIDRLVGSGQVRFAAGKQVIPAAERIDLPWTLTVPIIRQAGADPSYTDTQSEPSFVGL